MPMGRDALVYFFQQPIVSGFQPHMKAIEAGVTAIGENRIQEAERKFTSDLPPVEKHLVGHLQRNKVKKAVALFDMIETVDSLELAVEIDKRCAQIGKIMPVLIEINSGREPQKSGVLPEEALALASEISALPNIRLMGLMTMGPRFGDPEQARPYFQATRAAFERLSAQNLPNVTMRYLSMGMSNSYQMAIEEGANIVRIGTRLFGERGV